MTVIKGIPVPPSTNALYRNVAGKGRVRTERYVTWANAAGWLIQAQRPDRVPGRICLDISVQRQRANSDISNRIKAVEDLLVALGVIDDDKNVDQVTIRWASITGCNITITPSVA